jgi:hypothetical protein
MVHVGDIKTGSSPCLELVYESVSGQLLALDVPTFIIPGDNEWNDCDDPDEAWDYWLTWFSDFENNFQNPPIVERQDVRHENFAWTDENVLLIGINLVGGTVHDDEEWATRHQQNAEWVTSHFEAASDDVYAAVVFGHAHPSGAHDDFIEPFRAAAAAFARPVLYIHGDGHVWIHDHPWPEENMTRVQVDRGGIADPVQVTVWIDEPDTFVFDQSPFD